MLSASQSYWDMMASGIRESGELIIKWYIDDTNVITLTSNELSMNSASTYDTFFDPLMTELPYTKFNFTIIDNEGLYDPMGLTENPLDVMQMVTIVYRQYLDSSFTTYEDIAFDTLYTTGESAYNEKEFTIYCQDKLSIAFTSEDVYVENDTIYTLGQRNYALQSSGRFVRYFGEKTPFELVCALLDDMGISYVDNRRVSGNWYVLPLETYIEKGQKKVDLLQALLNANLWSIYMKNDVAHINSANYPPSRYTNPSDYLSDYSITNEDMLKFPVIQNMTQAKQMNVMYQTITIDKSLTVIDGEKTTQNGTDLVSTHEMYLIDGTYNDEATSSIMTARYNSSALRSCFFTWQKTNAYDIDYQIVLDANAQITSSDETFDANNVTTQIRPLNIVDGVQTYPTTIVKKGEVKNLDNRYVSKFPNSIEVSTFYYNYSVPKNHFSLSFRGEPCLELNDFITVQTEWENDVICRVDSILLTFNGALESTISVSRIEVAS